MKLWKRITAMMLTGGMMSMLLTGVSAQYMAVHLTAQSTSPNYYVTEQLMQWEKWHYGDERIADSWAWIYGFNSYYSSYTVFIKPSYYNGAQWVEMGYMLLGIGVSPPYWYSTAKPNPNVSYYWKLTMGTDVGTNNYAVGYLA